MVAPALFVGVLSTCDADPAAPRFFSASQSVLTISSPTVTSGSVVTVTLELRDATGVLLGVGGHEVVFALSGGSSQGTFGAVVDHGDGRYTSELTGTVAGTATPLTATVDGTLIASVMPAVTTLVGPASPATSTVEITRPSVSVCDGGSATLRTRDAAGNVITTGSLLVAFTRTGFSISISGATDNGNGTYSAYYTATTPGTSTVGATIGGIAVTTPQPTVTVSSFVPIGC